MPPTTAELALDSLTIGHAAGMRETRCADADAYARMRNYAKDDAEDLLVNATGDDDNPETIAARKRIVLHLGVNQLAQAINYHGMIHANLVIDADTDQPFARCPICHAELVERAKGGEIACRARVSPNCYHGRSEKGVYPDGADDDGTYREEDGTVVCDPCYIALGQPLRPDLDAAVAAAQAGQEA